MVGVGGVEILVGMILTLAIPIVFFFVTRWAAGSAVRNACPTEGRTARDILDERYARGEIWREEHERMRRDIEG